MSIMTISTYLVLNLLLVKISHQIASYERYIKSTRMQLGSSAALSAPVAYDLISTEIITWAPD